MSEQTFTTESLVKYNGQNGQPAYVAIDGTVYDVSAKAGWAGGKHHGNMAGKDLSNVLPHAPHKDAVLKGLPVVGKLVD